MSNTREVMEAMLQSTAPVIEALEGSVKMINDLAGTTSPKQARARPQTTPAPRILPPTRPQVDREQLLAAARKKGTVNRIQAGDILSRSERTIRRYLKNGKLQCNQLGEIKTESVVALLG